MVCTYVRVALFLTLPIEIQGNETPDNAQLRIGGLTVTIKDSERALTVGVAEQPCLIGLVGKRRAGSIEAPRSTRCPEAPMLPSLPSAPSEDAVCPVLIAPTSIRSRLESTV